MASVYAQDYGLGEIVKSETVHGRTSHLVVGEGFKAWVDATKVASTTVDDGDSFDNSTVLPYDPSPQYPTDMFTEETIQPGDYEIDKKRRLSPSDSRSFKDRQGQPYPGPNPKLFAKGANHDDWNGPDSFGYYWDEQGHEHDPSEVKKPKPHHKGSGREYEEPFREDPDWFRDMFDENPEPVQYHEFPEKPKRNRDLPTHKRDPNNPYRGADPRIHEGQWQALLGPLLEGGGAEAGGLGIGDLAGLGGLLGAGGSDEEDERKKKLQEKGIDESPLGMIAGLSDKYATWMLEEPEHLDEKTARFRANPIAEIEYQGHINYNPHEAALMEDYGHLVEADAQIRTAAWTDVREKAMRLRRDGKVHVKDMDVNRIYATVEGDHGTYDVMIHKGAAMDQSVSHSTCSCPWGSWQYKRRLTYVGRMCAHQYASYLEMQSRAMRDNPEHFTPKYSPWRSPRVAGIVEDFKKYVNDSNQGHTDQQAADNFISTLGPDEVTPEEAAQLYDYVEDNLTEKAQREFDVPYTFDQDQVIKEADALRTQPKSLTPDLVFHDEDDEDKEFFDDVTEDTRETTGPDQIVHFSHFLREADEMEDEHKAGGPPGTGNSATDRMVAPGGAPTGPDPAEEALLPKKPDESPSGASSTGGFDPSQIGSVISTIGDIAAPIAGALGGMFTGLGTGGLGGIGSGVGSALSGLHFGGLTYIADNDLLNRLRDLSAEKPEENFGHLDSHDEEIADICDELHERGYDANRLVASLRSASYGVGNQGAGPGGAFMQPGGGNWADLPAEGSGPDPKFFFSTSEDYVEEHEKKHHQRVDEGDGPIVKYTDPKHAPKQRPKQSGKHPDAPRVTRQRDRMAAEAITGPEPSGGTLPGSAGMQQAYDIAHGSMSPTDLFNPANPPTAETNTPGQYNPTNPTYSSRAGDDSDIVRQFHASGGGALAEDSGDYSDEAIVKNAQKFLRTAGRVYSLAEQKALEDEQNPLGARNLPTLDELIHTHYANEA